MSASLPMYDWPEIRRATDAWWQGLALKLRAEGLTDVPLTLQRSDEVAILWAAPDLLFSQTCGYPLTHEWMGKLAVVATPHYDADGCSGPDYCSFVLARRDDDRRLEDFRGAVAAYNGADSQSGYSALRSVIAPLARNGQFFGGTVRSGGHLNSMQMVASGEADLCAVDAVCWALARRHHPNLVEGLRSVGQSNPVPGLPYVTAAGASPDRLNRLRAGLGAAFDDAGLSDIRQDLLLNGFTQTDASTYQPIIAMERDSIAQGYSVLQ